MEIMLKLLFVLFICLLFGSMTMASSWDGFPIISQFKSAVLAVVGDIDGARQTQKNFLRQMPVISQITSGVQAIMGDFEAARETQKQFLRYTIEGPIGNIPVVGHIKGGIHLAMGDTNRGIEIMKSSSSNTIIVIGGMLGGSAGAVSGKMLADTVITAIDSAVNRKFKPNGLLRLGPNSSAGEHFDQLITVLGAAVVGNDRSKISNAIANEKTLNFNKIHHLEKRSSMKRKKNTVDLTALSKLIKRQ